MRFRSFGMLSVAAVLAAGSLVLAGEISQAQDPGAIIEERQARMKENGTAMRTIGGYAQAGVGTLEDVSAAAATLAQHAIDIPDLYPQGTSLTDITDPETGAKPVIWEKWNEFLGEADALEFEALKLKELADNGNGDAISAQFEVLSTVGCGGCHQTFRQKLD
ncbi:MAG: cytochrome c [Pseudomonadota bacterium]